LKKKLIISLMVALVMVLVPSSVAFAYDSKLVLENKDSDTWEVEKGDGVRGVMWYDSAGSDFSYSLKAKGLEANEPYSLIYYADPWAGDNPGALIAEGTTNSKGKLKKKDNTGEVDLGMSLPHPDDANYPDGAKIWLVPSDCYDADTNTVTSWQPSRFLFETELITYERTTPSPEAYNRYKGLSGVFWVEVLNYSGFDTFKWDDWNSPDRVLAEDVIASNRVNGTICTLYIPEGTHLSFPGRPSTLVTNLFVEQDDGGEVYFEPGNMDFSQQCSMQLIYPDGTVVVTNFSQIRDGQPVIE